MTQATVDVAALIANGPVGSLVGGGGVIAAGLRNANTGRWSDSAVLLVVQ